MAKAKKVIKSSALSSKVTSMLEALAAAQKEGELAVASLTKDRKKLTAESKRLSKKKSVLSKRKAAAAKRLKKTPGADNRKALSAVTKELTQITAASAKARAESAANLEELNLVKASLKQATAYSASIAKADKVLNKPKKKRRAKKRTSQLAVAA